MFSTSHYPTNGKPDAAIAQRTSRGEPGSESSLAVAGKGMEEGEQVSASIRHHSHQKIAFGLKYASENGNAAAVKKFKATHEIGESTVRLFKKRYLDETETHLLDSQCSPKCPARNY